MAFSRHIVVLRAMQDISHGDTRTGMDNPTNSRLFMTGEKQVGGETVNVPEISGNSMRNRMSRSPLGHHLYDRLGIGRGDVFYSVHKMLLNGGNLTKAQEAGVLPLMREIRELYPSLDLVGGATDSFTLGPGNLRGVAVWPMIAENEEDIRDAAPHLLASPGEKLPTGRDALSMKTRIRNADDPKDMMPYSYQVMASGVRIVVEITLAAGTPDATRSAAAVALREWDLYFGGQGRQGHGRMAIVENPGLDPEPYEKHIEENKERMRAGLLDGTLGTRKVVCGP